jgi:hypothetical protein
MRVTRKQINNRLAELGHNACLEKRDDYFHFASGETTGWLDRTVKVSNLSALTLDQWVDEFKRLEKLNEEMLQNLRSKKKHQ